MSLKDLYTGVRDFLFSSMNRQFLVFMFFLILSSVFWLFMTLNNTYEREIKIPARIANIPPNVVLTSAATDTVRVTIRDKGWVIASYLYGERLATIHVPFKSYDKTNGSGSVGSSELKRQIEQLLEASSKIVSVKPERMEFFYNYGEYKRVPVRWTGRVSPDQLYFIADVRYSPDSVDVYTAKEKLDSISTIYTEPLSYENFRDSLTVDCKLAHSAKVKVVPETVRVRFYTDVLTEETFDNVPVQCVNLPPGTVLRTFPTRVAVHFVAGVSQLRTIRPEDFVVIADYQEIISKNQEKCDLYLRTVPQGVSRAALITRQVDYLIEKEE